jgi:hypothetical protein
MGFLWHPTGGVEAGIDGFLEIRDPVTGVVTSCFLPIQSRATSKPFQAETSDQFEYLCDPKDLDYWLAGNAPVILVRSRPSTNEAYWVSVKDYFRDPVVRKHRRVVFDKKRDRFDETCRDALVRLAVPKDSGLYLAPLLKPERLYSNLLKVASIARLYYSAETEFRTPQALWSEFRNRNLNAPGDWILQSKRIISFHDLRQPPWSNVCDLATLQFCETNDWSLSNDPATQRDFVRLLNRCLTEKLKPLGVRYYSKGYYYYFLATPSLATKSVSYKSLVKTVSREVFKVYRNKKDPNRVSYCRHAAFEGRFHRYGGEWFLEVTPTYHFTWDGYLLSRFADDLLKQIKMLERNAAVIGQLLMWASCLAETVSLYSDDYPFLKFGNLHTFELDRGINDAAWLPQEEDEATVTLSDEDQSLFE